MSTDGSESPGGHDPNTLDHGESKRHYIYSSVYYFLACLLDIIISLNLTSVPVALDEADAAENARREGAERYISSLSEEKRAAAQEDENAQLRNFKVLRTKLSGTAR